MAARIIRITHTILPAQQPVPKKRQSKSEDRSTASKNKKKKGWSTKKIVCVILIILAAIGFTVHQVKKHQDKENEVRLQNIATEKRINDELEEKNKRIEKEKQQKIDEKNKRIEKEKNKRIKDDEQQKIDKDKKQQKFDEEENERIENEKQQKINEEQNIKVKVEPVPKFRQKIFSHDYFWIVKFGVCNDANPDINKTLHSVSVSISESQNLDPVKEVLKAIQNDEDFASEFKNAEIANEYQKQSKSPEEEFIGILN
jgi:hypothetical protein